MKPHIEEALKTLALAERDIYAFKVLKNDPDAHNSVVCFHAQQAIEKSLKAVLFCRQIEFRRIHDLLELTALLRRESVEIPLLDEQLNRLNPFAVTFRYDDIGNFENISRDEAAEWVSIISNWAKKQIDSVKEKEH